MPKCLSGEENLKKMSKLCHLQAKCPTVQTRNMRQLKFSCLPYNKHLINQAYLFGGGGAVASWLVCSFPERVVRVQALAGDTVLCSWGRHLTLTVPLSTQEYKRVLANCWGNLANCGEVTCNGLASHPGGVEILLAASRYGNRDKLWQL